jgi:hypothetical protein
MLLEVLIYMGLGLVLAAPAWKLLRAAVPGSRHWVARLPWQAPPRTLRPYVAPALRSPQPQAAENTSPSAPPADTGSAS